ncbi:MAG: cupin domain-containing protein [Bacteroidia bacterium]|nr:cupin domain-containing protein [Bacteroidia bacterium]
MRNFILIILLLSCLSWQSKAQYNNDLIIEPILKTDTTSLGQKINYPNTTNSEVTMLKITIPPGKTTGWHEHDNPVFAYILKGILTVELEGNKVLKFAENSSFSEVIHTAHRGINKESGDLVLLAFYLGEKGKPLSVRIQKE